MKDIKYGAIYYNKTFRSTSYHWLVNFDISIVYRKCVKGVTIICFCTIVINLFFLNISLFSKRNTEGLLQKLSQAAARYGGCYLESL